MNDKEQTSLFQLTYKVDGQVCYSEMVEKGKRLGAAPRPTKPFHTFSGWDKIPSRMPARDVTVEGSFLPCEYTLTFRAQDTVVSEEKVAYGAPVTAPEAPEREGFTFEGWKNLPETMPGEDTTVEADYSADTYKVVYTITDATGHFGPTSFTYPCRFGAPLPEMDIPQRPYYSFSGWGDLPETMPAHDVELTGALSLTLYKLTRIVDGEVFREELLPFGAPVAKKPNPEKEGYYFSGFRSLPKTMPDHDVEVVSSMYPARFKADFLLDEMLYRSTYIPFGSPVEEKPEVPEGTEFLGWDDCPETMPAHDIEVHGHTRTLTRKLSYAVRGRVVHTDEYLPGAAVTAAAAPALDGYTFLGWTDLPETMPDHDITVNGEYKLSADRVSYVIDGEEYSLFENTDALPDVTPDEREGYTFSGWGDGVLDEDGKLVISGTYQPNSYTVTFVCDGETVSSATMVCGDPILPPEAPVKENRTFLGWKNLPETMPARDITVEAEYGDTVYRIEYVADGNIVAEYARPFGAALEAPEAPAKEGYTFTGWINPPETMPAYDLTVNGMYIINTYTVTFLLNGEPYATEKFEYGDTVTAPTPEETDGMIFGGWKDLPATMPASDITVHGTMGNHDYHITFTVDGETYAHLLCTEGTATVTPETAPEKEGYTFRGWSDLPEVMPGHDITVAADFAAVEHRLAFEVAGECVRESTVAFGTPLAMPEDLTVDDPAFSGWSDLPETMPDHDVTVTAKLDRKPYVLRYLMDGELFWQDSVYPGDPVVHPEVPAKAGYVFAGWRGYVPQMPEEDVTVNGFYLPNSHKVTYMADGEVFAVANALVDTVPVAPAVPHKDGYVFAGWEGMPEVMPDSEITVNARFDVSDTAEPETPAEGFVYRFMVSGELYCERRVPEGQAVTLPEDPFKYGYTFDRWDDVPETAEADAVLYAHFRPNTHHLLCLDDDIVICDLSVNYGDPVILPSELREKGIVAWDGLPAVMPDRDVVICAIRADAAVRVACYVDGELLSESYVRRGEPLRLPAPEEKTGYDFSGWDKEVPAVAPDEDIEFHGTYKARVHIAGFICCGEEVAALRIPYGAPIEAPAISREIEEIYYDRWDNVPETMPDEDITIYAVGHRMNGTVTFLCEGETVEVVRAVEGMPVRCPETPVREGYTFEGWKGLPETFPGGEIVVEAVYTPNIYKLTYSVKGQNYKTVEYPCGAAIEAIDAPTVKKRSFVAWSGLPSVMPPHDLRCEGLYVTQNTFLLSYRIDGEPYAEAVLEPGTKIQSPTPPAKDGYVFSGWDKNVTVIGREPITVNGSYIPTEHTLTYRVNGEVYATYTVSVGAPLPRPEDPDTERPFRGWTTLPHFMPNQDLEADAVIGTNYTITFLAGGVKLAEYVLPEGSAVTTPEVPAREGYSFEGWDVLPEVLEADTVCTAKYKPNTYTVTFMVDGDVYAEVPTAFGRAVELPDAPEVVDMTFLGWKNLPDVMPAENVTATADFTPALWHVTFVADGVTVADVELPRGRAVTPPEAPEKEGYTFLRWDNLPDVMPAEDVIVTAVYDEVVPEPIVAEEPVVEETAEEPVAEETAAEETTEEPAAEEPVAEETEEEPVAEEPVSEETEEEPAAEEPVSEETEEEPAAEEPVSEETAEEPVAEETTTEETAEEPVEEEPVPVFYTALYTVAGEPYATYELLAGEEIPTPDDPHTDRAFIGWADHPAVMPESDITIDAVLRTEYRITFISDGETIAEYTVREGDPIPMPEAPVKAGYVFIGWDLPDEVAVRDLVCTAAFTRVFHTLTYCVGDNVIAAYQVAEGEELPVPATDTIEGFIGWSGLPAVMPAEDLTVSAEIAVCVTVRFVADGVDVAVLCLHRGDAVEAPEAPEKEGYDFVGWTDLPEVAESDAVCHAVYNPHIYNLTLTVDGSVYAEAAVPFAAAVTPPEDPYFDDGRIFDGWADLPAAMPASDVAVAALYHYADAYGRVYTVTFVVNDTVYATAKAPEGYAFAKLPDAPAVPDMDFVEWEGLPAAMPASDLVVYAKLRPAMHSVKFVVDDEVVSEVRLTAGTSVTPPDMPAKEGYDFTGWGDLPLRMGTGDLVVYGHYLPHRHEVRFMLGKKIYATAIFPYGRAIVQPDVPVMPGCTFLHWEGLPETMPDNDLRVLAVFTRQCRVSYYVDDELVHEDMLAPGSRIVPPEAPVKYGYTFSGWSDHPSKVRRYPVEIRGTLTPNLHTVTYMAGGEVARTEKVPFGAALVLPVAPALEGRIFTDWGVTPTTMPDEDITLTANYAPLTYKVIYLLDGTKLDEAMIEYGAAVPAPAVPRKVGYSFSGWTDLPATMPAMQITLGGHYVINRHKVTYMNGADVFCEQEYEYGQAITPPTDEPVSKKRKLLFSTWDAEPAVMADEDVVIHAVFETERALRKRMHTVFFKCDNKVVAKQMVLAGRMIPLPAQPEKRDLRFDGWTGLPVDGKMPATDLICTAAFKPIVSTATYMMDGDVYYQVDLPVHEKICPPSATEKEGMVFVGWDNLPQVMPPYSFIATARYEKKKYKVRYFVDGELFAEESYPWGESVTPQHLPDTTDKVFEGWDCLPVIMPMHDVERVNARFHYRDFKVTYVINNVVVTYNMVPCYGRITPPSVAPREGKRIIDWINMPEGSIMPPHDLVLEAVWGDEAAAARLEKRNARSAKAEKRAQKKAAKAEKKAKKKAAKDTADLDKRVKGLADEEIRRRMGKLMK